MAARKKASKINLLPQEEFAASTLGRVFTWILTSFRYMVIATELIVILAFLSRFWLDAKTTDLNDELKQKTAIVQATSNFEKDFRQSQNRLKAYASLTKKEKPATSLLNIISSYLPPEAYLSSISLIGSEVQIKGSSFSERAIAQFISNLNSLEDFENVTLTQVDTSERDLSTMIFAIRLTLKGDK